MSFVIDRPFMAVTDMSGLFAAAALGIRPADAGGVADWAAKHRRIAEGTSAHPGRWDHDWAPFLVEIMDCLSPDHPCATVTVMKSVQTGGTEVVTNWLGFIIDRVPGACLVVHPTIGAGEDWVREKLNPTIEVTPVLARKVAQQRSRSDAGSTFMHKKFAGGFISITGANSAAGLRQKSIRFAVLDDWDQFTDDLDGQGDPTAMVDARQTTYLGAGISKQLRVSTPIDKATSNVYKGFQESDQRHFEVPCPHCDDRQVLEFENMSWPGKDDDETGPDCKPEEACFSCIHCGCDIEESEKPQMLRDGVWRAKFSGEGRQPGFHIWSAYSRFEFWADIARKYEASKGDRAATKAFTNLVLGLPFDSKGEAAKWEDLFARRDAYKKETVPDGAYYLTCAVDVQKDGLYFVVKGWGDRHRSWTVDYDFIAGTTTEEGDAWDELKTLLARKYPTALGGELGIGLVGVDSGYRADSVYEFVKYKRGILALKGQGGNGVPAIVQGRRAEIVRAGRKAGQKKRRSIRVWHIGTWDLKSTFYEYQARKVAAKDPHDCTVAEFIGFPSDADEIYFQQITSEARVEKKSRGRTIFEWVADGDNHYLDCEIYNMALADQAGLWKFQPHDWARLREACKPQPGAQKDMDALFDGRAVAVAPPKSETDTQEAPPTEEWVEQRDDWLN